MNLFYMGGPLFMSILTLIGLIMLSWSVAKGRLAFANQVSDRSQVKHQLSYIKSIGLFALITGILGQLIGLYDAFLAIEKLGEVSPAMLAGGLKVSSITTIYGMLIFLLSYLIWFGLDYKLNAT